MHEVLCCAGTTTMLRYYDYYKGTGFGKASKADIRNFRCPIKSLMQGDATHKKRTSGTKEVHAHAAHLDDEDVSCACCADQQPKRVKFAGPWPTLRGTADQPPELRQSGKKPAAPAQGEPALRSHSNKPRGVYGSRSLAQGERTTAASAQPLAQGEPAQGEQDLEFEEWQAMPACYSTTYCEKAGILKRDRAPHDEWHIDWAVMGQGTLGLNGEAYALVVLDVGSGLGAVINTKTREDPW